MRPHVHTPTRPSNYQLSTDRSLLLLHRLQHRLRVRSDAAPYIKGLRRLFDEHAPAGFGATRADGFRPAREDRVAFAVGHVVAERGRADDGARYRRNEILKTRRSGIEHEIERAVFADAVETAAAQVAERAELARQLERALRAAVRDLHVFRCGAEQWPEH